MNYNGQYFILAYLAFIISLNLLYRISHKAFDFYKEAYLPESCFNLLNDLLFLHKLKTKIILKLQGILQLWVIALLNYLF